MPQKVTQKSSPYRGHFLSLQMASQGGGKLGANQYLPGATKKAGGKGHSGYMYGEEGVGIIEGFTGQHLHWSGQTQTQGSGQIKAGAQPHRSRPCRKTRSFRAQTGLRGRGWGCSAVP